MYKGAAQGGVRVDGAERRLTHALDQRKNNQRERYSKEEESCIFSEALRRCLDIIDADPVYNVEKYLKSFVPPYDKNRVQQHIREVLAARTARSREAKSESDREEAIIPRIFEQMVIDGVNHGGWMGPHARAIKASPFDDEFRKTDFTIEHDEAGLVSHMGLAVDVTTSQNVNSKLVNIREEIRRGTLGSIEYFYSPYTGFRGQLEQVPRVVVGADRIAVMVLMNKWNDCPALTTARLKNPTSMSTNREVYPSLMESYIQFQILEQISMQLKEFGRYAAAQGHTDVAKKYARLERLIDRIKDKKMGAVQAGAQEYIDQDAVFGRLCASLEQGIEAL